MLLLQKTVDSVHKINKNKNIEKSIAVQFHATTMYSSLKATLNSKKKRYSIEKEEKV